jgi:hypothetical protein
MRAIGQCARLGRAAPAARTGLAARSRLVSRWQRRGPDAATYDSRYAEIADAEGLRAQVGCVGGVAVVAMFRGGVTAPAYFVRIEWTGDRIALVRDVRDAPYVVEAARFEVGA